MAGNVLSSAVDFVKHVQHLGLECGALANKRLDLRDIGLDIGDLRFEVGQALVKGVLLSGHRFSFVAQSVLPGVRGGLALQS